MTGCLNCGKDSNLMLSIELKGESLMKYCLESECLEAAKFTAMSMKGQMRGTHYEVVEKGGICEDKNS